MLGALCLAATLPACRPFGCPQTVDQAASGDFGASDESSFVAVGRVARFVASPDALSRGYDLEVRRVFIGRDSGEPLFLRVGAESPDVRQGDAVLIVAEAGSSEHVVEPGLCAPLRVIGEDEFDRWTD